MNEQNKITLVKAQEWAKEWRDTESTYNKYHELKAFNIPKEDLIEVLQEKGVENIRAYVGVEKTGTGKEATFEEKLMIVGVDGNGGDMLPRDTKTKGSIYDFTRPCPSGCDPSSPLNG